MRAANLRSCGLRWARPKRSRRDVDEDEIRKLLDDLEADEEDDPPPFDERDLDDWRLDEWGR